MNGNEAVQLFSGGALADYLGSKLHAASNVVEQISKVELLACSAETLAEQIVGQLSISPLVIHPEQMQRQQTATKISKEVDASDYGMPVKRWVMVNGNKMHYIIPFTGDAALWHLRTSGPSFDHAAAIDAVQSRLTLTLQNTTDVESPWYQRQMEQTLDQINLRIGDQTQALKQFHPQLATTVKGALALRLRQVKS